MFTLKRIQWPSCVGHAGKDLASLVKAMSDWFLGLETKGALYALGDNGTVTGTPTSGTGTFTAASYTITWTALGDRLCFNGSVSITTNGTAAASVVVPLPSGYIPKEDGDATGCDNSSRLQLVVKLGAAAKIMAIVKYDGTYAGGDNKTLLFSGQFRF